MSHLSHSFTILPTSKGGLVSSRQAARRGAKSAMISSSLAGGDCLNFGCVPSKSLIRCARMIREVRKAKSDSEFGVKIGGDVEVDFGAIMRRMRKKRAEIAPVDGHTRGEDIGVSVIQGFGRFISSDTVEVVSVDGTNNESSNTRYKFKKAVICTGKSKTQKYRSFHVQFVFSNFDSSTFCSNWWFGNVGEGGRAVIPTNIPGLADAPYTTNENLFNLRKLPKHMVVLGSGG